MTEGPLREPVRPSVVRSLLGLAALPTAAIITAPAIFALGAGDTAFALRAAVVVLVFLLLAWAFHGGRIVEVRRSEARVVATLLYVLVPLGMTLPLATHTRLGLQHSLFESISAFTTSGLSMMDASGAAPSLLFARAWLAWVGGFTAVALAVTVLTPPSATGSGLDTGSTSGTRAQLRRVFATYLTLTVVVALALTATGLPLLRALLHAFGSISTGGMSPDPHGLRDLVPATRIVILGGAFCGSLPMLWLGRGASHSQSRLARWQLGTSVVLIGVVATFVALSMRHFGVFGHHATPWDAVMFGVSAQTTLGLEPIPVNSIDPGSKLALCVAMACGGSFGSAAGGLKVLRLLLLLAAIRRFVVSSAYRRGAPLEIRFGGVIFDDEMLRRVLLITVLFCATLLLSWLPFVYLGKEPLDALFNVVSATSNCGLSAGAPLVELPPTLQVVLMIDMLLGRLEFLAVLLVLYPGTWIGNWRTRAIEAIDPERRV